MTDDIEGPPENFAKDLLHNLERPRREGGRMPIKNRVIANIVRRVFPTDKENLLQQHGNDQDCPENNIGRGRS